MPVVWRVLAHQSSSVAFKAYKNLLSRVSRLLPKEIQAVLLADRGFVDTELMKHCEQLGWKYRIRTKQDFWVCRPGGAPSGWGSTKLVRAILQRTNYQTFDWPTPIEDVIDD